MSTSRAGRTGTILSLPERVIPQAPPPLRKGFHAGRRRAALASLGHRPSDPTGFDGDVSVRYEAVYRRAARRRSWPPPDSPRRGGDARVGMSAPIGGHWLVAPVGSTPQFTGADFTEEDLLYAKTAEDFVRHEVLGRLAEIEEKREGVMPELLKRAGALGLLMIDIPERHGGLGLHY